MSDPTNGVEVGALAALVADLSPYQRQLLAEHLRGLLEQSDQQVVSTMKVHRLEVVDDRGRCRIALGDLGRDLGYSPGLAVFDRHTSERITLMSAESGPLLAFALGGNDALVVGVDDPDTEAIHPGPYLELINDRVGVVLGWRVDERTGEITREGQGP